MPLLNLPTNFLIPKAPDPKKATQDQIVTWMTGVSQVLENFKQGLEAVDAFINDNSQIATGVIEADNIIAGTITADLISTTGAIITQTIQIQDAIITDAKVINLDGIKITADSITANQIAASAITVIELASSAVTSAGIAASAILATHISPSAITTPALAASSVVAATIAAGAVVAGKIDAAAVTTITLAADAVTADKIAANAVTASEIAAGAVTATKISVSQLSAIAADMGTLTAGTINGGRIISGATSGAYTIMNPNGVAIVNAAGTTVATFSSASTTLDFPAGAGGAMQMGSGVNLKLTEGADIILHAAAGNAASVRFHDTSDNLFGELAGLTATITTVYLTPNNNGSGSLELGRGGVAWQKISLNCASALTLIPNRLTINASTSDIQVNWVPGADATYTLGNSTFARWKGVFLSSGESGSGPIDTIGAATQSSTLSAAGTLSVPTSCIGTLTISVDGVERRIPFYPEG